MEKEQKSYPPRAVLEDGTEIRLVPPNLTGGKPLYVSKDGQGYSYVRERFREIKPRLHGICKDDPKRLRSYEYRNFKNVKVHVAVLSAWVCPRPKGMQCDHINGNHFDNRLENLQWVTPEENVRRRWIANAKQGKSYSGKRLTELGKKALRHRRKYAEKHGILIQLEIQFEEEVDEKEVGISLVDKIIEIDGEAVSPNK